MDASSSCIVHHKEVLSHVRDVALSHKIRKPPKKNQKESVIFNLGPFKDFKPIRAMLVFQRIRLAPNLEAGIEPPALKLHMQCRKQPLCQWGPAQK